MKSKQKTILEIAPFDWVKDEEHIFLREHGESKKMLSYIQSVFQRREEFKGSDNYAPKWKIDCSIITTNWRRQSLPEKIDIYVFYKEMLTRATKGIEYKIVNQLSMVLAETYVEYLILPDFKVFLTSDLREPDILSKKDKATIRKSGLVLFSQGK